MAGSRAGLEFFKACWIVMKRFSNCQAYCTSTQTLLKFFPLNPRKFSKEFINQYPNFLTQENQTLRDIICWGQIKKNSIK